MATYEHRRLEDAITLLLAEASGPLSRTALMKLLYFADLRSYERRGEPITATKWVWHHFGPFTKDVYEVLDVLELNNEVHIEVTPTYYGSSEYQITPADNAGYYRVLSAEEVGLLRDVVKEFGRFTPQQLAKLSYWTEPMQHVGHRGQHLSFDRYLDERTRPVPFQPDPRVRTHPKMRS